MLWTHRQLEDIEVVHRSSDVVEVSWVCNQITIQQLIKDLRRRNFIWCMYYLSATKPWLRMLVELVYIVSISTLKVPRLIKIEHISV